MYNNSTFHDFTKSVADGGLVQGPIGPTREGNYGFYLLADQQIWQSAPDSAKTAYRGLYAGATVMYARPQTTPITQYYEGRLYMKAPFASRPKDLVSLVGYYQVNSPYLVDNLNTLNAARDIREAGNMVGDRRLPGESQARGLPHPRPQLHGESFAGILLWSFAGEPFPALSKEMH